MLMKRKLSFMVLIFAMTIMLQACGYKTGSPGTPAETTETSEPEYIQDDESVTEDNEPVTEVDAAREKEAAKTELQKILEDMQTEESRLRADLLEMREILKIIQEQGNDPEREKTYEGLIASAEIRLQELLDSIQGVKDQLAGLNSAEEIEIPEDLPDLELNPYDPDLNSLDVLPPDR